MKVIVEEDVLGLGLPIRLFKPSIHRNLQKLIPLSKRSAISPYNACSISDFYLMILDYPHRKDRANSKTKIAKVTEATLPLSYDISRVFYGEFLCCEDRYQFSFGEDYNFDRAELLQQMLVRAFAHHSICDALRNIKTMNPDVYLSTYPLGAIESLIAKYRRRFGQRTSII